MSEETCVLLLIDDDDEILQFLKLSISSTHYDTVTATSGQEALRILNDEKQQIDAIISDVVMPEMDGYQLCTQIRDNPKTTDLPFIFLSSKETLEEKLIGFDAGGDDYATKPVNLQELLAKLQRAIDAKQCKAELDQQLTQTSDIAMQAMTYTSRLGEILEFLQSALQSDNHQQLAEHAFKVTSSLGLHCNLQFRTPNGILDFTKEGDVSPLESNIIEMAQHKGRFFDFGKRTIINYEEFSLLAKNMPVEDPDKYGQTKDLLGNLCNAINAEVKLLNSSSKLESKDKIINSVNIAIDEVGETFHTVHTDNSQAIQQMVDEMEEAMLTKLGLEESQEETIRSIIKEMKERTEKNFYRIQMLKSKLKEVRSSLENAAK